MGSSDNLVDIIHDKISLSDYIGKKVKLNKKGNDYIGLCPFHNEKTPSFIVSDSKGFFHCFGCSVHGDIISFVMQIESIEFKEALEVLSREIGIDYSNYNNFNVKNKEEYNEIKNILELSKNFFISDLDSTEGLEVKKYLEKRNISKKAYKYFELGYAKNSYSSLLKFLEKKQFKQENLIDSSVVRLNKEKNNLYDFFRSRLIFPIHDFKGNLIAFGGRAINGVEPKYINSSDSSLFKKRKTLYNLHRAIKYIRKHKLPLILVEGYIDVIAMYHIGMYGSVAPLGTSLSEEQLNLMWKYHDEPIICMDGDNAGYKSAVRTLNIALPILKPGKSLQFVFLPEGQDPDNLISLGKKEILEKNIDNSISMFDFFWKSETENVSLTTPERRVGFKKNIEKKISYITDNEVKQEYKNTFYNYFNKFVLNKNTKQYNGRYKNIDDAQVDKINIDRVNKNLNVSNREKNLIESVINNPSVLNKVEEGFSVLPISNKELDSLRLGIIEIYKKNGSFNEEDVEKFKKNVNYSRIYDKYFNNVNNASWTNRNFIPPYVKKNSDINIVIKNWKEAADIQLKWYKKNYSKINIDE